ncbi:MAG: PhzF family phenazine biosynthesis protein [Calditrichota bacterium]
MKPPIYTVDAFAERKFAGNPAGVCVLDEAADEAWMRQIAREMNLSETAFVHRMGALWKLRWFTPAAEVKLCGHATLATSHILWTEGYADRSTPIEFSTLSGILNATLRDDGRITLAFPPLPESPVEPPPEIMEALGVTPLHVGQSRDDYLALVNTPETVKSLKPNFALLHKLNVRGVMVTAQGDGQPYDFVSRFFAPGVGIDEDPVTGSAHCCLGPFWAARLGKNKMLAYQASARGGVLEVQVEPERIHLTGKAFTVFKGRVAE